MKKNIKKMLKGFSTSNISLETLESMIKSYESKKGFASASGLWMQFYKIERELG